MTWKRSSAILFTWIRSNVVQTHSQEFVIKRGLMRSLGVWVQAAGAMGV